MKTDDLLPAHPCEFVFGTVRQCKDATIIATRKIKPFSLGKVVATPGALAAIEQAGQAPAAFLDRHAKGDWGVVSGDDWVLNDDALEDGTRILSAYRTKNDVRIWIITESDRSSTCILLPNEY